MMGQLINSHALHLFFFSLSDFFGFKSDLELINEYPEKTHDAMKIRDVGNKLVEVIGGRAVHPLTPCIGGLRQAPNPEKLKALLEDCQRILPKVINLGNLFINLKYPPKVINLGNLFINLKYPDFSRKTTFVSLTHPEEYAIYDGKINVGSSTSHMEPGEFLKQVKEFQGKDKVVKRTHIGTHSYMVGALARLHNNRNKLNPEAQKLLEKSGLKFPCYNPFYNILAQAVELIHCFEESTRILTRIINEWDANKIFEASVKNRTGQGIGAMEAPRGTLFYDVKIKDGIVEKVNIITPTAQNIANLEDDLEEFEELKGFNEAADTRGDSASISVLPKALNQRRSAII